MLREERSHSGAQLGFTAIDKYRLPLFTIDTSRTPETARQEIVNRVRERCILQPWPFLGRATEAKK